MELNIEQTFSGHKASISAWNWNLQSLNLTTGFACFLFGKKEKMCSGVLVCLDWVGI